MPTFNQTKTPTFTSRLSNLPVGNILKTGIDLLDITQRTGGARDVIDQRNQGLNQATDRIVDFGDRALTSVQEGAEAGRQSITDATGRAVAAQQPFYDEGLSSLAEFRNILDNPDQILEDPGVKFQFQQGEETLKRNLENAGQLGSGRRFLAAQEFGQGLASTSLDSALNRRLPLIQAGQGAANNISNVESAAGTNLANIETQTGRTLADINLGQGANLASLAISQNNLLSERDVIDAQQNSGLLDIGSEIASGLIGDATVGSIMDSAAGMFGGAGGAGAAGAGVAGAAGIAGSVGTPAALGAGAGGTLTGANALGIGSVVGGGAEVGTLAGAVNPQGASLFNAPGGFGNLPASGGAAGADAAAPGFFSTPAGAAALAGPIAGITALLRGQGMGQAVAQGGGAAAGAAAGMALTGGNPIGAVLGGFVGSMAGGKLGKALGISASGGGDDKPDYSLGSGDNLKGKEMVSTGVWGTVGFGHQKHLTDGPRYKAALDVVTETDSIISAALTPEENAKVKEAFKQNFIGSNSNEGGFNPGRLMNQVFTNRAETLQKVLGPQRFNELKLNEVYQALASGDQAKIQQTFGA